VVARGRPGALRSAENARCTLPHCDQLQAEAIRRCNLDQIAAITMVAHAHATGGGFPDASQLRFGGTHASRMHSIRNMQLACSQARPNGQPEATQCLESRASIWTRVYRPKMFCATHTAGPYQYATNASFKVGCARLGCAMRLAPTISPEFSRSNARGRSDLHRPNDAWTSQTHDSPGIRQDRRGTNAASSPFRQDGVSRLAATGRSGLRQQIDGIGRPRATLYIATQEPRDDARVPRAG
jgi:hypothetical protein